MASSAGAEGRRRMTQGAGVGVGRNELRARGRGWRLKGSRSVFYLLARYLGGGSGALGRVALGCRAAHCRPPVAGVGCCASVRLSRL